VEKEIRNIVVIGSGNVAWHFIKAFSRKGIKVLQILGHNERTARSLSLAFSVPFITDPFKMISDADLYILAVQDAKAGEAALNPGLKGQPLIHTSGFLPLEEISGISAITGVVWPLQTLTAGTDVDYQSIPFFIEGSTTEFTDILVSFAGRVSDQVMVTDSLTRQKTHLAAVIASNLTNRLYSIAASILERNNIPFHVLDPLIRETASKALLKHPLNSQTGPAFRNDLQVIAKHLEWLRDEPEFLDIYRLITENIIQHYSSENE
jgi:predicted short-subunit dehydrogenase-like oxidoreductase (DUF2520 family)